MESTLEKPKLDVTKPQKVSYCIPNDLRDEQIRLAIGRVAKRIQPVAELRGEPLAIVCFGPSLNDTWEQLRQFKWIMTCSGAHKFLVERGIVPTHHVEVDPRAHKVQLIGPPQDKTEYYIASACHPKVFDHLEGKDVRLWHVFDTAEEGFRILPPGEWALMGGSSVGLRCFSIARFLGFDDFHVFGMDGCSGKSGTHSDHHPNRPPDPTLVETEYGGVKYRTTVSMAHCAQQTFTELDKMPSVRYKFYGEGLVQHMARNHAPAPPLPPGKKTVISFSKPELISDEYRDYNRRVHQDEPSYGLYASRHADLVIKWSEALKTTSILDYGCGKGRLGKALPFPIWEYDPAVVGKSESPRPADIVLCLDVLEHVEPDKLRFVLDDLKRCTRKMAYFVIHCGEATKKYPNGKNTHLIQEDVKWWARRIERYFKIGSIKKVMIMPASKAWNRRDHFELKFICSPLEGKVAPLRRWDVLEDWVCENGWTVGAEVGVKEGRTFLHLLQHCPRLTLLGVDLFEPRPGLEREGGESFVNDDLPGCEARLRRKLEEKFPGRSNLRKGDSLEVAKTVPDGSLDFVFIDADHREEAVLADIAAWRPKVRKGGMLCGHDAQAKFPGVLAALAKACPGWSEYPDSVWGVPC